MWALQTLWTAAQALAVFEVLDDLRNLVVDGWARRSRQAALLNIQPLNGYQSAGAGPAIMTIAANVSTLRLKMVRDLCSQLKSSALRYSDTVVTLAMDQNMPQHAVRVTLLARQ